MQRTLAAIARDDRWLLSFFGLALMFGPCVLRAADPDSDALDSADRRFGRPALEAPALVLNPADWLVERDAVGGIVLHAVVPGTRLRDLSQPGWRIESELVSGTLTAVPTRPGSDQRDERREPVPLAEGAAAQLALMAPAAGARVWISLPPRRQDAAVGRREASPPVVRDEHGFIVPPANSTRPMIAPQIPGFPTH